MAAAAAPVSKMSRPDASDLFMARREDLRLVKTPRYPRFGPGGRQVGEEPGEAFQFRAGVLRVPHKGTVELEDGRKISADEARAFLLEHRLLGDSYGGFWRVDPVAPPVSEEELGAILDAALAFDVDALQRIVSGEESGWGREAIINKGRESIEKIEAALAEAAAQSAAKGK